MTAPRFELFTVTADSAPVLARLRRETAGENETQWGLAGFVDHKTREVYPFTNIPPIVFMLAEAVADMNEADAVTLPFMTTTDPETYAELVTAGAVTPPAPEA